MDLIRFKEKSLFLSKPRRKWLILMAISGVSGYGVYKVYHLPSITRKRNRLLKIFEAIFSVSELISDSSETISIISRDLKRFLNSYSEEIPNSLKQISKITKSDEFTDSLIRVSRALTIGIFRGYNFDSEVKSESSVVDKVIDKVFSKSGSGFVSVIVSSFVKNLVLGLYSNCDSDSSETPQWLNLLCDDKFKEVIADCIERFTSTAVSMYLDKTMEINTYDQIFTGLTNPKHQDNVKDLLVSICNGALETLVRTSHQVYTTTSSSRSNDSIKDDFEINGWAESISSTLSVPSNIKFLFDVTGRVTLETTRSIIGFIMLKTFQGFRKSFDEVRDKGRQVFGYVGDKSLVITTLWLAVYLHIISSCVPNSPIGLSQ